MMIIIEDEEKDIVNRDDHDREKKTTRGGLEKKTRKRSASERNDGISASHELGNHCYAMLEEAEDRIESDRNNVMSLSQ